MSDEVREPTNFEKVYRKVFDPENGLEKRVGEVEERTEILERINDFWRVIRWPLGILVMAILSQVGSWLVELIRGIQ